MTNVQLIDRVWRDLRLNVESVARRYDLHHFFAGRDHAAHGVHRHLVNGAVLRGADLDAREHVLRRDLLLGRLGYFGAYRGEVLANLGAQILVDLDDLQLDLGDLVLVLCRRGDELAVIAFSPCEVALQGNDPRKLDEVFLPESS